jgi:hypothetical protein
VLLAPIIKQIKGYDAAEWELFTHEWQQGLNQYHEVKRLGGAGDHGRDVIGLCSPLGCEGVWDNYQCKNYQGLLQPFHASQAAGKIIFHGFRKVFKPPRRCYFVAPRGPTTALRDMLLNPSRFRDEVIDNWDVRVAGDVVENEMHVLTGDLAAYVAQYDFSTFGYIAIEEMLETHRKTAFWAERFGGLLPKPNLGVTPDDMMQHETVYVGKLLEVYAQTEGASITEVKDLDGHPEWKDDLQKQRVRFFDAEAFMATYRDQTEPGTTESFADQIFDAIDPSLKIKGLSGLDRLTTALTVAGQAAPASVLSPQAKIGVKQGVCHQLANDDRVTWKI